MGHRRIVRRSHAAHRVILTEHLFDWAPRELGTMRVSPSFRALFVNLVGQQRRSGGLMNWFRTWRFSPHFLLILQKVPPNQKWAKCLAISTFSNDHFFRRINFGKAKSSANFRPKYTNFRYLPNCVHDSKSCVFTHFRGFEFD